MRVTFEVKNCQAVIYRLKERFYWCISETWGDIGAWRLRGDKGSHYLITASQVWHGSGRVSLAPCFNFVGQHLLDYFPYIPHISSFFTNFLWSRKKNLNKQIVIVSLNCMNITGKKWCCQTNNCKCKLAVIQNIHVLWGWICFCLKT